MDEIGAVRKRASAATWARRVKDLRLPPRVVPFTHRGLLEVLLIGSVYLVYIAIRGEVSGRETEALRRGIEVVDIEKALRIYHEEALQDWLLQWPLFIGFLNAMYFVGHFPPLLAFALWIYRSDRAKYVLVRNTFLLSAAIGLALYWLIPTTPPRLLPPEFGYVDTLQEYGPIKVYDVQGSDPFVNEHAAIPSLHFGWAALLSVGFAWSVGWRWYGVLAAVAWPLLTLLIIEGTANHFILDAVAGILVVTLAFIIARWLHERFAGRAGP